MGLLPKGQSKAPLKPDVTIWCSDKDLVGLATGKVGDVRLLWLGADALLRPYLYPPAPAQPTEALRCQGEPRTLVAELLRPLTPRHTPRRTTAHSRPRQHRQSSSSGEVGLISPNPASASR